MPIRRLWKIAVGLAVAAIMTGVILISNERTTWQSRSPHDFLVKASEQKGLGEHHAAGQHSEADGHAKADELAGPAEGVYLSAVRAILAARCYKCHGAVRREGGLRVDTVAAMLHGGDSGSAITPGNPDESPLIAAVRHAEWVTAMPKDGNPLTASQIAVLADWVKSGAIGPQFDAPDNPGDHHWAYRPPVESVLPASETMRNYANPIDLFVAAARDERGLRSAEPAPKDILLRRIHLDLIGLPPTEKELDTFLNDESPEAYERVVERLLGSPQYGVRWGRHWLDVWRYKEHDGRKSDKQTWTSSELIWVWRDWVMRSLNVDKGYDRMILEMLAGDELATGAPDSLAGTGFLVRNWDRQDRNVWIDQIVEHTSKAFLGLQLNCARCHDHKFDPIPQVAYYRFRACFEPHDVKTESLALGPAGEMLPVNVVADVRLEARTTVFLRGDYDSPIDDIDILPGVPDVIRGSGLVIHPVYTDRVRSSLTFTNESGGTSAGRFIAPNEVEATDWGNLTGILSNNNQTLTWANNSVWTKAQPLLQPDISGAWLSDNKPTTIAQNVSSTGRRLALARWIVDPTNPLTARVAVNHVWMRHFGVPLVETVTDFGLAGRAPTHPQLLDWLAVNFRKNAWSLKWLHRQIVTSQTYRMQSGSLEADAANTRIDPDNHWLWRMNARRMEGEIVRDSMLSLAGALDQSLGGTPLDHESADTTNRRSLYYRYSQEDKPQLLEVFDAAEVNECYRRDVSIVPQQSLALCNGPFIWHQAARIATRLPRGLETDSSFVRHAFRSIIGRSPSTVETTLCQGFLSRQRDLFSRRKIVLTSGDESDEPPWGTADAEATARTWLVHALLNHNDFVTIR
jgi:hypothetical protein